MGDHRGGSFFNGVIDEVAIFKGELDKDDIEMVMNSMEEILPVSPLGHLTTTWGKVKQVSP